MSGPILFWPQTATLSSGTWTPVGKPTLLTAMQHPAADVHDLFYIWTPLVNVGDPQPRIVATFLAPAFFGTPTSVRFVTRYAPYGIAGQAGGSRTLTLSDSTGAFTFDSWTVASQAALGPGSWTTRTTTITTDPRTSAAWTLPGLTSLMSDGVRFFASTVSGQRTGIAISNFFIEPVATHVPGNGRWKKGPLRRESPGVCDRCGRPMHRSELIQVLDPNNPDYGLYLCAEDYDNYTPPDIEPRLREGDIEFFT